MNCTENMSLGNFLVEDSMFNLVPLIHIFLAVYHRDGNIDKFVGFVQNLERVLVFDLIRLEAERKI